MSQSLSTAFDDPQINDVITLTDIQEHLQMLTAILTRHPLDEQVKERMRNELLQIEQRSQDPNLYLAVVGEMSSGKSTFINALLRDALLETDVKTMTTAASTLIKPGKRLKAEMWFQNQTRKQESAVLHLTSDDEPITLKAIPEVRGASLRDVVRAITSDDAIASHLRSVVIEHPADFLHNGIFIIDTPGSNADNPDHTEVTQRVVAECDVALILVAANQGAVSRSMREEYLKDPELIQPYIHRCIFILTKMDLLPEQERRRVISFVKNQLVRELQLSHHPRVLIASAAAMLDGHHSLDTETRTKWQQQFLHLESEVFDRLKKQRSIIISENILRLINRAMSEVVFPLESLQAAYTQEAAELEAVRIPDLYTFTHQQRRDGEKRIETVMDDGKKRIATIIGDLKTSTQRQLNEAIDKATNKNELNEAIQKTCSSILSESQSSIQNLINQEAEDIAKQIDGIHARFDRLFQKEFEKLAALQRTANNKFEHSSLDETSSESIIQSSHKVAEDALGAELVNRGIGTVVGGIVGAILLPGAGWIVGAAVGNYIGKLFGPSLDELKQKAKESLTNSTNEYFTEVQRSTSSTLNSYEYQVERDLHRRIDAHVQTYEHVLQEIETDHQRKHKNVRKQERIVEQDLANLRKKQRVIVQQLEQLHKLV